MPLLGQSSPTGELFVILPNERTPAAAAHSNLSILSFYFCTLSGLWVKTAWSVTFLPCRTQELRRLFSRPPLAFSVRILLRPRDSVPDTVVYQVGT